MKSIQQQMLEPKRNKRAKCTERSKALSQRIWRYCGHAGRGISEGAGQEMNEVILHIGHGKTGNNGNTVLFDFECE